MVYHTRSSIEKFEHISLWHSTLVFSRYILIPHSFDLNITVFSISILVHYSSISRCNEITRKSEQRITFNLQEHLESVLCIGAASYSDLFWFMRSYFAAARSVLLCRGNLGELKEGFNCRGSSEVNSFSGFYWKLINSLERR